MKLLKFLSTSLVATTFDISVYSVLIRSLDPYLANMISASLGMLANFLMQWFWVFHATRKWYVSFIFSAVFSVGGIFLGSILVYILTTLTPLSHHPMTAKFLTVVFVFFYNYLTKKFSFGD